MKPTPYQTHLQSDFNDASGTRCRSFCQVDETGRTFAFADFEGRECVRIGGTFKQRAKVEAFLSEVAALVECVNPGKMVMQWENAPGYVAPETPRAELILAPLFARA